MNLLCHHATVRPTIARCAAQIEAHRAAEVSHSSPGICIESWRCALGDKGFVTVARSQTHFQIWEIEAYFSANIGGVKTDLTRAEIHAISRATQSGRHFNFAKIPDPKKISVSAHKSGPIIPA